MATVSKSQPALSGPDWSNLPLVPDPDHPGAFRVPDHRDLPDSDDEMENGIELPQTILLSDSISDLLDARHPDKQFFMGSNNGIYWTYTEPVLSGAIVPDWFYVPNVPPHLEGGPRRSYVMWKEKVPPFIVLEFVSGDGSEERDRTPYKGKFWVYENMVQAEYYGIYDPGPGRIELYELIAGVYQPVAANERGHYPVARLGVELGLRQARYFRLNLPWLRWWDANGNLMLTGAERASRFSDQIQRERRRTDQERERANQEQLRAEQERERANQEQLRAEQERERAERQLERAERLAARLRDLGIDPNGQPAPGSD